jgi:hypothetical protein
MVAHSCNPILGRWRQKDLQFYASLGYIVKTYLKKQNKTKQKKQGLGCGSNGEALAKALSSNNRNQACIVVCTYNFSTREERGSLELSS